MRTIAVLFGRFALVCIITQITICGARADEMRARVETSTVGGFARIVFTVPGEARAEPRMENGALVLAFALPVRADVADLAKRLSTYVKSARAETGIVRLTLAPKIRANVMLADDKLFVDLLPRKWTGAPPPLPTELLAALQQTTRGGTLPPDREPVGSIGEAPLKVELAPAADELRVVFPFANPTPAALFRRGDTIFALFETERQLNISPLAYNKPEAIRGIELVALPGGRLLRLKLAAGRQATMAAVGERWVLRISERALRLPTSAPIERLVAPEGPRAMLIPLAEPSRAYRIVDPASDEQLVVITALARSDGLAQEQDYVEFKLLASGQGLAIAPRADDLSVQIAAQSVIVSRSNGLAVSAARASARD